VIRTVSACAIMSMLAGSALAAPPAALDFVPPSALAVVALSDLADTHTSLVRLLDTFSGVAGDVSQQLSMVGSLLSTPGLNEAGSLAMVIMPGEDGIVDLGGPRPPMFMIVPVDDFGAFTTAMNAQPAGAMMAADFMGETVFMKDIGAGYAMLSPDEGLATLMNPAPGQLAGHADRLGPSGVNLADSSDVVIVLDARFVGPMLVQASEQMADGMEMLAAMSPEAAGLTGFSEMFESFAHGFSENGRSVAIGLNFDASGLSLDLSTQFREGSMFADLFQRSGDATDMIAGLPKMPVVAAMAIDTSSPKMKETFVNLIKLTGELQPGATDMMGFGSAAELIEYQDGSAFVLGEPRSLMFGAVFENTMQYTKSSDPDRLMTAMRKMTGEMKTMQTEGIGYEMTFEQDAARVDGKSVDEWGMRFQFDPGDPTSQQMGMAFGAIFGPAGGPQGYYAKTDKGVITTYSRSRGFLRRAIASADGAGDSMMDEANIAMVTRKLPAKPMFVAYLGVGQVLEQVSGLAGMFGAPLPIEVEKGLAPIGFGVSMEDGGMHARLFVPQGIMNMIANLAENAGQFMPGGGGDGFRPGF
jgi:hypothetical protein